jgi:hypothetical protein
VLLLVFIHYAAGVPLLAIMGVELIWGLPLLPRVASAVLPYLISADWHSDRGRAVIRLRALYLIVSCLSGFTLILGLVCPETILGDQALIQTAIWLFESLTLAGLGREHSNRFEQEN